jgi:hypothetical protein
MATQYHAPKPRYSDWEWFKFITARVVFPPLLLWDLLSLLANKLIGEFAGSLVLFAQRDDFKHLAVTDDNVADYNTYDLTCQKYEVITHDEVHLDTLEIRHKSQENLDPRYQSYIINAVGAAMAYEQIINEMKADAHELEVNVVGFNFRGVGQSTGKATSKDDLVIDGIAQVQRLLDQGISPENITWNAHSFGAAVATLVVEHFHKLGQPINLFSDRPLSSITNFLVGHIRLERNDKGQAIGQKEHWGMIILGWLATPFIKFVLVLINWEIDAGYSFKAIPEAYKDYTVIRPRKEIRDQWIGDQDIPHYASIHADLSSERSARKASIVAEIAWIDSCDTLDQDIFALKRAELTQEKLLMKSDKKVETYFALQEGHSVPLRYLPKRSNESAWSFFGNFFQKTHADQGIKIEIDETGSLYKPGVFQNARL